MAVHTKVRNPGLGLSALRRLGVNTTSTMNDKSAFAVWGRAMMKPVFLSILLLGCVVSTGAQMKDVYTPGIPPPPASMDPDHGKTAPEDPRLPHIDPAKMQRDADDLARTAQTIPIDVANVRRGTLPKDTIQKLKEIEKLSKRLRSELNP